MAALNTNRIAERTGISVGTLYGYFPDKTAILVARARRILREDQVALVAAIDADAAGDPVRALVRALLVRHRSDRVLRRAVMAVHIGEGHGDEHGAGVEGFVAKLVDRVAPVGDLRLFVAVRAALGVARARVEENEAQRFPDAVIEDEIVRLVESYLRS